MTFPILTEQPTYNITLPSGKKVTFRPFLEKERKVLLMAYESNTQEDALEAIVNILRGCVVSATNIQDLSVADVEYFFLQLRAKSMGEIVKLNYFCKNVVDGQFCMNVMTTEIDISKVEVTPSKEETIRLNPNLSVKMKNPSFMVTQDISDIHKLVAASIDFVANEKSVLHAKDYPLEDMVEFVMNLTPEQFSKLEEYVNNLPVIKKNLTCVCKKCGFEHEIKLEGYQSFFI